MEGESRGGSISGRDRRKRGKSEKGRFPSASVCPPNPSLPYSSSSSPVLRQPSLPAPHRCRLHRFSVPVPLTTLLSLLFHPSLFHPSLFHPSLSTIRRTALSHTNVSNSASSFARATSGASVKLPAHMCMHACM